MGGRRGGPWTVAGGRSVLAGQRGEGSRESDRPGRRTDAGVRNGSFWAAELKNKGKENLKERIGKAASNPRPHTQQEHH